MATPIQSFSCHLESHERTNLPCPIQIFYVHSVVPMLIFFWCWEVSAAGGVLLSTVSMPALKKVCPKCSYRCKSESLNVLVTVFFLLPSQG